MNPFANGSSGTAAGASAAADQTFHVAEGTETVQRQPLERDVREGLQLLQLAGLEGRTPLQDAIRGRVCDTRLNEIADGDPDPARRQLAVDIRNAVNEAYNQVAPLNFQPAELATEVNDGRR